MKDKVSSDLVSCHHCTSNGASEALTWVSVSALTACRYTRETFWIEASSFAMHFRRPGKSWQPALYHRSCGPLPSWTASVLSRSNLVSLKTASLWPAIKTNLFAQLLYFFAQFIRFVTGKSSDISSVITSWWKSPRYQPLPLQASHSVFFGLRRC